MKSLPFFQDDESGAHRVLICTNDFARGISIDTVRTVVNLDFPEEPAVTHGRESTILYTHRIGRAMRSETAHGMVDLIPSLAILPLCANLTLP